ncbi:MAG: TetR/AcrR family transcriptional regulator C-terminal domain-containing protein [Solirubrobacteraceae bacterium]|nr:TetR/AcrR family transcriptional regulator C-terminal domain-containing protein [Solirubrobacteraceae bacterium]
MTAGTPTAEATPPPRRRRGLLNPALIARTARDIADADGLGAVTMRALAQRLDCTPRALYRHVDNKEAVLELLADHALSGLPEVRRDVPWQDALLEFFVAFRELLVAEPAVARVVAQQVVAGDNFRRHADRAIALLLEVGFAEDVAVEAVVALAYYTLGAALPGTGQPLHDQWKAITGDGLPPDALPTLARVAPHLAEDTAGPRFRSALRRMVRGYALDLDGADA